MSYADLQASMGERCDDFEGALPCEIAETRAALA
jgi:hypothetical protein